jgi:glycosyltransferase involved in cell wall biosynthesis
MASSPIKVSILCITFNHKKFIKECLDSFLMQKTQFNYEIIIHDDASTDGTQDIIRDYQEKNPGLIKTIFQKENQYSRGGKSFFIRFLFPRARGEYIALCEGDDYWTDPNKLQKQIDFLDNNPDYSLCFHPVRVFYESTEKKDEIFPTDTDGFDLNRLLEGNFIQTNSVVYRKPHMYKDLKKGMMPGDYYMHLFHAQFGKIGFINDVMSVYRRHEGGIWWDKSKVWKEHGEAHLRLYAELLKMFGENKEHNRIIYDSIIVAVQKMAEYSALNEKILMTYPDFFVRSLEEIVHKSNQNNKNLRKISRLENKINELESKRKLFKWNPK